MVCSFFISSAAQTHAEERVSQDISLPVLKQTELHIVHLHRRFLLAAYTRIRLLRLSFSLHIQYLLILLIQELQAIARVLVVVGFSVAGVAKRPSHVVNLSVLQKLDHVHRNDLLLRIRSIPSDRTPLQFPVLVELRALHLLSILETLTHGEHVVLPISAKQIHELFHAILVLQRHLHDVRIGHQNQHAAIRLPILEPPLADEVMVALLPGPV